MPFAADRALALRRALSSCLLLLCVLLLNSCGGEDGAAPVVEDTVWLPEWEALEPMTVMRAGAAAVVHDGRIYMIGGVDGRIYLRTVESARILQDGRLSSWRPRRLLPEARGFADAVVHGGYLYVIGGANGRHGENLLASVVRARIQADGELGEWETLPQTLRLPRRCAKVCLYGDRLLALGGYAGSLLDSVEWTLLGGDGSEPWRLATPTLTRPRYVNAVKRHGDHVYVLGGHDAEHGVGLAAVEFAPLDDHEPRWRETTPLQQGRYGLAAASWGEYLYALGGITGSEYLDRVEFARLGPSGDVGPWRDNTSLPEPLSNFNTLVVGDVLYVLGGAGPGRYSNRVYRASIRADGRLGMLLPAARAEQRRLARQQDRPRSQQASLPHRGRVMEILQTPAYSYIRVRRADDAAEQWLAAPVTDVRPGQEIAYSQGVSMGNFYSKTLARHFDRILFVGTVKSLTGGGK